MESRVSELEKEVARYRNELTSVKKEIKVMVMNELQNCREIINRFLNFDRCQFCQAPVEHLQVTEVGTVRATKMENTPKTISFACLPDKIFTKIFEKLDHESLKNSRLVSQSWNKIATYTLARFSTINLNKFFGIGRNPNEDAPIFTKFTFPAKITIGLVNHIQFSYLHPLEGAEQDEEKEEDYDEWKLLTAFCKKYGTEVRGINATVFDFQDQLPLCKVLKDFCPNLDHLYLCNLTDRDGNTDLTDGKYQSLTRRKLPWTLALKSIVFETYHHTPELNSFAEDIIKLSTNLQDLTIDGEMYPDLSNNKKLKNLEIIIQNYPFYLSTAHSPDPSFNISMINKMFKQVRSSLEKLALKPPRFKYDNCQTDWSHLAHNNCILIPFTLHKLKVFINESIFIFPVYSVGRLLSTCRSLHTLKLSGEANDAKNIENIFKPITPSISFVTNLSIGEIEQEYVLKKIITIFPLLTKLEFTIGECTTLHENQIKAKVRNLFAISSIPKLDELKIKIRFMFHGKLSFLLNTLAFSPNFLKGMKNLTIENLPVSFDYHFDVTDWRNDNIDKVNNFKNALVGTRDLKRFQLINFHVHNDTALEIKKIIKRNSLPVHFWEYWN